MKKAANPKQTLLPFRYQRTERLKGAGHTFSLLSEIKSCKLICPLTMMERGKDFIQAALQCLSHVGGKRSSFSCHELRMTTTVLNLQFVDEKRRVGDDKQNCLSTPCIRTFP